MLEHDGSSERTYTRTQSNRLSHMLLLFIFCVSCFFYFGYSDTTNKEEFPNVIKVKANIDESTIYYHNKIYVHPSLSLPQISIRLLNETKIHIESSSNVAIPTDYILSWKFRENNRIVFKPFKARYGLISLSACKSSLRTTEKGPNFIHYGLIRANRKLCKSHSCNSWSCQKDYDYFNKSYDSKYCMIVIKSNKLRDILQFTHDFLNNQDIPPTKLKYGMFCGNPLISRSANTEKELYFVNFNSEPDKNPNSFFICKFSILLMDVIECYNTEVISSKLEMPLMMIHDPTTDVLMTANYNPDNKNLNLLTFKSNRLSFKAAFRSIPSPSGWIINLGKNSKGKVFFAGDSAPYEVLGVYDTGTSKEKYHNLYL